MLFKNLWVDPKNVVCVFADCEASRARVTLKEPASCEVFCDLESAQRLIKHLDDNDSSKPPKK